jgi:hypothetical protein
MAKQSGDVTSAGGHSAIARRRARSFSPRVGLEAGSQCAVFEVTGRAPARQSARYHYRIERLRTAKARAVIKLMRCLKRRSDVSSAEFRRFWNDAEYEALLDNLVGVSRAVKQNRSLTLQIDVNKELAELHGTLEPYDGVVEICWTNAGSILALRDKADGMTATDDLLAFEDQFIDRGESRYFFTE